MTLRLLLALLAIACVACGSEPATNARCELGRSAACTCSSGAAGAQECGPSGVWSPCVCAAPDAATVDVAVVVDAPADTAPDVAQVDAASDVAVVERDVPGLDVAVDASPAADADAAVDAPPPIGDRVERMQVWLSLNGAPAEYEPTGSCSRTTGGNVRIRSFVVGDILVSAAGARLSATIQCPGAIDEMMMCTRPVLYRSDAGANLANASAAAGVAPPVECRRTGLVVSRFEVFAFGCPVAP